MEIERTTTENLAQKSSIRGVLETLSMAIVVVVSLLSFPSVLPWMIAVWLVWHTVLAHGNRPAWVPLVACLVIMVVKLVPRTHAMIVLGCVLALIALVRFRARNEPLSRQKLALKTTLVLWAAWGLMFYEWQSTIHCGRPMMLDPDRPVVCIGDSLTDGMLPDHGYPDPLGKMIRVPVVNLGFSGIATSQALGQMDRVLGHNPQVVVIELGGHDFLKGHSRSSTKANLVAMIEACRKQDAEVILMEIPRGFIFDPFASLEREIAHQYDVELVADTWLRQIVVMSPIAPPGMWMPASQLSDDGIHSNPRGSEAIAKRVAGTLQTMYGDAVLKEP
ncbi:Acyl-CoA thioesterase I precursor [Planctomycetes bacterium CA13]|uniref:Acyl-CoA thioesterase I n=1 Tax=Novipirellula herctigrandis TaxID=2527986 RepID=A0A5C5Z7L3_9BACT|nr:Acyl-CoA thioesterase I precursor [Planctomycetes bacterium CA13]